jgi:uncharacterized coiled-coil DUF342 family protein
MEQQTLHTLRSLLSDLEKVKTDLTREGQSFSTASLFSVIQALMNLEAHCPLPDYQKILDISNKLTNVMDLIQFSKTILRNMESNEPLAPNEETFLEYISMVSQISGMTLELQKIQWSTDSKFEDYTNRFDNLKKKISHRFYAFEKYMTYSQYLQRLVPCKTYPWKKNSGSPSKTWRTKTDEDYIEIKEKEDAKKAEIKLLSDECQGISGQKTQFLERLSQLFALVSEAIEKFGLKSSPEISFFLSGFDPNHFDQFRSNFRMINEKFQLLKTEIDAFNQHVNSLREKYLIEYNKPDEYLTKWNTALESGNTFFGKQD